MNLSEEEIRKRLQDLRNVEMLHGKARDRVRNLEQENKKLKEKVRALEKENNLLKNNMESVSFQLEQLKIKVFGKKPDKERITLKRKR